MYPRRRRQRRRPRGASRGRSPPASPAASRAWRSRSGRTGRAPLATVDGAGDRARPRRVRGQLVARRIRWPRAASLLGRNPAAARRVPGGRRHGALARRAASMQPDLARTLVAHRGGRARRVLSRPDCRADRRRDGRARAGSSRARISPATGRSSARPSPARTAACASCRWVRRARAASRWWSCSTSSRASRSRSPATIRRATIHLVAEAARRVYADRVASGSAIPAFTRVPVEGLTSKAYAAGLRASIDPARATPSAQVRPGTPAGARVDADDPLLGRRRGGQRRRGHDDAQRRLRQRAGRAGRRVPAQQRDGRLQRQARHAEHVRAASAARPTPSRPASAC